MLFLTPSTFQDSSYEVVSVERSTKPAFRLGCEVIDRLVVKQDGKNFTITLSTQHSNFGPVKLYAKGDKVEIKKSEIHNGDLISRDSVRLVR